MMIGIGFSRKYLKESRARWLAALKWESLLQAPDDRSAGGDFGANPESTQFLGRLVTRSTTAKRIEDDIAGVGRYPKAAAGNHGL